MRRIVNACAILILTAIVFVAVNRDAEANSPIKITAVKISRDMRRVVVKGNGPISTEHLYRLEGKSRLAIMIPDAVLGDMDRTIRNPDDNALLVYVSPAGTGVKIVLDFGKTGVPDFKIRVLDDCLIALLGPSGSHASASQDGSFGAAAGSAGPQKPVEARQQPLEIPAISRETGDLTICSAEVIDGLVVVQVASKENGGRKYKIKLGLNLEDLGFNSATVSRVREHGKSQRSVSSVRSSAAASTSSVSQEGNLYHVTPGHHTESRSSLLKPRPAPDLRFVRAAESQKRDRVNTMSKGPVAYSFPELPQTARPMPGY